MAEMGYESSLNGRYASTEMKYNFSAHNKFSTWRRLWLYLARAQKELGVRINDNDIHEHQLNEMENNIENIDFALAAEYEKKYRHDVVAHIHTFAKACPTASPIIHLGATSCFVTDNADLILIRKGLDVITTILARCINVLSLFAKKYRFVPTLGYTHFQAAQLTTVGKRACLWLWELLMDESRLTQLHEQLHFRGAKGATGTQASFMSLFQDYTSNASEMVEKLDHRVADLAGFSSVYPVVGQTYSRKVDTDIVLALSSLGATAHKISTDIRLLAHEKEIEEPFDTTQVGSSAMPYKRNPIRCERICGLSRHLITLSANALNTGAIQWFERSLDDSSNRRITISEAFLTADAVLGTLQNVLEGLIVNVSVIERNIRSELPFLITENIIVAMVKLHGCDRQECHEKIRFLSMQSGYAIKNEGKENDLIERIKADEYFAPIKSVIDSFMDPTSLIGRAPEQVSKFLENDVEPVLAKYCSDKLKKISVMQI